MGKILPDLIPLIGIMGIGGVLAWVQWTKVALGAFVTIVGAFFPSKTSHKTVGSGTLKLGNLEISLVNSLRIGVIFCGILIVFGALVDGAVKARDKGLTAGDYIIDTQNTREMRLLQQAAHSKPLFSNDVLMAPPFTLPAATLNNRPFQPLPVLPAVPPPSGQQR